MKDKTKDIVIVVLLCIIFCLVGLRVGYYFGNSNKVNNTANEKKNDSAKPIDNKENKSSEDNKTEENKEDSNNSNTKEVDTKYNVKNSVSTTIKEALTKNGYNAVDLIKVFDSNSSDGAGLSFKHNDKSIYIDCSYTLTSNKVVCDNSESIARKIKVYYYNGYYFVEGNLGSLSIIDNNFNAIKKISFDNYSGLTRVNNDIFYGSTSECEGIRSDGTNGMVVTVHKFNIINQSDEAVFNIDHDAGWAC